MFTQLVCDPGFGQIALRAQGAACHGQPAGHQRDKIHLDLGAAEEGDLHKTAIFGQRLQVARDVIAAHHIEDQVSAAFGFQHIHKIGIAIVDRGFGPQFGTGCAFAVGPCCCKDTCAKFAGKLDGCRPDARRPAVDQKPFAGLQATAHENVGPDRKECFGQAGRFLHAHSVGHRQAMRRRCGHIFGIAATGQQGADFVADGHARNAFADREDFA